MRSRSPSSLVWPSSDSSFTGGDSDVHTGLDESVRNDSFPLNSIPWAIDVKKKNGKFMNDKPINCIGRKLMSNLPVLIRVQHILMAVQTLMVMANSMEMVWRMRRHYWTDWRPHSLKDAKNVAENCAINALRNCQPMTNGASLLHPESNGRIERNLRNDHSAILFQLAIWIENTNSKLLEGVLYYV